MTQFPLRCGFVFVFGVLLAYAAPLRAQTTVTLDAHTEGQVTVLGTPPIVDADIVYRFTDATPFPFTQGMLHEKADFSNLPTIRVYDGVFTFVMDSSDALFGTLSGSHHLLNATDFDIDFIVDYNGGTGLFAGAYGSGTAIGTGSFTSQTTAVSHIHWQGQITTVPEPNIPTSGCLLLFGIGLLRRRLHQRQESF